MEESPYRAQHTQDKLHLQPTILHRIEVHQEIRFDALAEHPRINTAYLSYCGHNLSQFYSLKWEGKKKK